MSLSSLIMTALSPRYSRQSLVWVLFPVPLFAEKKVSKAVHSYTGAVYEDSLV